MTGNDDRMVDVMNGGKGQHSFLVVLPPDVQHYEDGTTVAHSTGRESLHRMVHCNPCR